MGNSLIKNHKSRKKNCKSIKYMYPKSIFFFFQKEKRKNKEPFKVI